MSELEDLRDAIVEIVCVLGTGGPCSKNKCDGCEYEMMEAAFIAHEIVKKYKIQVPYNEAVLTESQGLGHQIKTLEAKIKRLKNALEAELRFWQSVGELGSSITLGGAVTRADKIASILGIDIKQG